MGFGKAIIEKTLLQAAARIWPTQFHEDMLIEEILELQEASAKLGIAILHMRRGRVTLDAGVVEELADVQVCIEQFIECHNLEEPVKAIREKKMARLAKRIESEDHELR